MSGGNVELFGFKNVVVRVSDHGTGTKQGFGAGRVIFGDVIPGLESCFPVSLHDGFWHGGWSIRNLRDVHE